MINYKKAIGKKLQLRRIEMGYKTQHALAEKVKVSDGQVNIWENGHNMPEGSYRRKLIELLKVDEDFFETLEPEIRESEKSALILAIIRDLSLLNETELRALSTYINKWLSQPGRNKSNIG